LVTNEAGFSLMEIKLTGAYKDFIIIYKLMATFIIQFENYQNLIKKFFVNLSVGKHRA
jgi:hypothetical protein